jgi:hypothetical protein
MRDVEYVGPLEWLAETQQPHAEALGHMVPSLEARRPAINRNEGGNEK